MSNHIVVSSISYAPISGDDEKVMKQTHKDLKDLVGQVARATTPDLIVLPETICRTCDEQVPEGPTRWLLFLCWGCLLLLSARRRRLGRCLLLRLLHLHLLCLHLDNDLLQSLVLSHSILQLLL